MSGKTIFSPVNLDKTCDCWLPYIRWNSKSAPARLCIFSVFIFIFVGKYRNMAQHTYDEESVQELLGWAKKMLETKSYPTEKYQLNSCTSIIDGKLYLESLISMISRNWENPTFHPTIEQLWEYREKWEGKEE